jgi:hypothetical protein
MIFGANYVKKKLQFSRKIFLDILFYLNGFYVIFRFLEPITLKKASI